MFTVSWYQYARHTTQIYKRVQTGRLALQTAEWVLNDLSLRPTTKSVEQTNSNFEKLKNFEWMIFNAEISGSTLNQIQHRPLDLLMEFSVFG